MQPDAERDACTPEPLDGDGFSEAADLPYGLTFEDIRKAMGDFLGFLDFVNTQLHFWRIERLEVMLMPAVFSTLVSEFMVAGIAKRCDTLERNTYHNGHPDLIEAGRYPGNSVLHGEGIEVKASRYSSGWQGHNPEDTWLLVFAFDANSRNDDAAAPPRRFRFLKVVGAKLEESDWSYSGRREGSRRTITASVLKSGAEKMDANWIYRAAELREG